LVGVDKWLYFTGNTHTCISIVTYLGTDGLLTGLSGRSVTLELLVLLPGLLGIDGRPRLFSGLTGAFVVGRAGRFGIFLVGLGGGGSGTLS